MTAASRTVRTAAVVLAAAATVGAGTGCAGARSHVPSPAAGADAPSQGEKLYIVNQAGASISVVDQHALVVDTVIDLTALGFTANAKPHHAAVERDGSYWYVTLIGDGKVLKFDRANRLVGQVSMETPGLLAMDPVRDSLYVGRSMTAVNPPKSLGVIRRSTFELVDEREIVIPRPHALVTTPDGRFVHAASLSENRIASLDALTARVTLSTLPGSATRSMVQFTVSPDGKTMVVGAELSNTVLLFDLTSPPPLVPAAELPLPGKPWDPVFSPDGRFVYFSLFADDAVAEIDLAARRVTRRFAERMAQPYDMIMRRDGRYLFVVNQNAAPVRAGASAHDHMPGMPGMPLVSTDGWLSIVDVASGKTERVLPLGPGPTGMGAAGAR